VIKPLLSTAAITLTIVAFFPYIGAVRRGEAKPHVFSWVIWGITTVVVFFAQLAGNAGLGAWPIGVSGAITTYVAYLAYRRKTDVGVTKADWAFFSAALSALPLWFLTADPLWAVVILTSVDLLGFGPTIRRAYANPHEEKIWFYAMFVLRNLLAIGALKHYSLTTVLFPAAVGLGCLLVVLLLWVRRRQKDAGQRAPELR
jgi:hypothetical protein